MRLDLQPDGATDLLPFQACSINALDSCEFVNTHAGVSEDGSLTWVYKGPVLEVINTTTGVRVTCLHVAQQLRDEHATVACVCEFRCQGRARLLVGVNGMGEQGLVFLLDISSSLVVKAVHIPQQVTCLESVLRYGGTNVPRWALSEQLRHFYGIVAVGTTGGYVYLVDMCLDTPSEMETLQSTRASPVQLLNLRERNSGAVRKDALASGRHLALLLGEDEQSHTGDCFHFRRPDLTAVQSFNEDEVLVTSLKYISQSGCLAIGYSFGGFHLWKLFNPALEYTSAIEPEDLPVAYFAYQEPENDPKNFAYLWIARDDKLSEQKQESLCNISLYQLCYSRKTFYANYGSFYEELNDVLLRMEHNLTSEPYNPRCTTTWSSQLLSAYTISDPNYRPPATLTINDSFEDIAQGPDLSLCAFVWEAQDSRPGGRTDVFLGIFDMNRWYHAQMPGRIKCVNVMGQECCPYFAVYQLSDTVQKEGYGFLQDVQIKAGSLLRFINNSPMPPEQHFYPSSLAFDALCVFTNGLSVTTCLGVQRQVLADLEASGPSSLLQPEDFYLRCIQTGLLPRSQETPATASLDEHQRMSLLSMALDQGKLRFITACVRSWADGEFIHQGCTLQFLLAWAWDKVTSVKQQIDLTCRPLYDWSGTPVDQRMLQVLHSCLCNLGHLRTILHLLLTQSTPVTDQGQAELEHRITVVTLLHHHLKLVLWFVHNGLLPEHDEAGEPSPTNYIYPSTELTQVFRDRRAEMKKRCGASSNTQQMILIDAMVNSAGTAITQLWQNEGGTDQYPPPSIHAALSTFLLDNVNENTKNAVLLYLLFDMAAVAHGRQEEFAEKIPLFAKAFDLPLGLVQQVHGFWLIDHMNFEEGLTQLLRQGSCQDLGSWQHGCILNALLAQGEVAAAARYLSARNPPVLTPDDVKMRLSILVASRLVPQAIAYVRHSCGPTQQEDMLKHVFHACQQHKLLELLLQLPLADAEEKCLQTFLTENVDATSAELLVLHLLQRAQYVPAIRLNDRMRHRATMDMSAKARERTKTRNAIVDGFRSSLPATQQYLIAHPPSATKLPVTRKVEVPRPKPLSTMVTKRVERHANSKSSLILAVMEKVSEAGKILAKGEADELEEDDAMDVDGEVPHILKQKIKKKKKEPEAESDKLAVGDPGPFLSTPTMSRLKSRLSMAGQVIYPSVKSVTTPSLATSQAMSPLSPQNLRKSRVFTADCMSLLQTPKVDHTPAKPVSPLSRITTPHSILKVSRVQRTSPRARAPAWKKTSPIEMHPKRLGFESSIKTTSPPSTPTSLSPSRTPSPTTEAPKLAVSDASAISTAEPAASVSVAVPVMAVSSEQKTPAAGQNVVDATPKHLRFASPEIQEISPPYISPDTLARPPLQAHATCCATASRETSPQPMEVNMSSDEEITFNFSRNQSDNGQDTRPPKAPSMSSESQVPSSSQPGTAPSTSRAQPSVSFSPDAVDPPSTTSPKSSRPGTPFIRGVKSPRSRVPSVDQHTEEEGEDEAESSTSDTNVDQAGASRQPLQQLEGQEPEKVSEAVEVNFEYSQNASLDEPVIEFEETSDQPSLSIEAMETVEPGLEKEIEEVRMRQRGVDKESEFTRRSEMLEVSDEENSDLEEINPPTPIQVVVQTPGRDRNVNQPKRMSRFLKRKESPSASSSTSKSPQKLEPAPPKLRKVSSDSPSRKSDDKTDDAPPKLLRIETKKDEDKNDNRASKTPPISPTVRSTRRSVERATPDRSGKSPTSGKVESPIAIHTESSSDEVMPPPPSPRRSVRQATPERIPAQRTQTPVRVTRSVDRETSPVERTKTPERVTRSMDREISPRQIAKMGKSVKKIAEEEVKEKGHQRDSSDSGMESSQSTALKATVESALESETALGSTTKQEEAEVPKSPSRRSTRRSRTPEIAATPAEPLTPTRRSRRLSHTPDTTRISPPPSSPGRRKGQVRKQSETSDVSEASVPVSPSRRSSRLASKEDRTSAEKMETEESTKPKSPSRSRKVSHSVETESAADTSQSPSRRSSRRSMDRAVTPLDIGESPAVPTPISSSPGRRSARVSHTSESVNTAETSSAESSQPVPASPSRRSRRLSADRLVAAEVEEASQTVAQSPSRRSTRRSTDRTTSADSDETGSTTPSRRNLRQRSKTPELSPSRYSTRLRSRSVDEDNEVKGISKDEANPLSPTATSTRQSGGRSGAKGVKDIATATEEVRSSRKKQKEEDAAEVKDITVATEEVRSSRQQQKGVSPRTAIKKNLMSSLDSGKAEESGFQFAAPTPLARLQNEPSLAAPSEVASFVFSPPLAHTSRQEAEASHASTSRRATRKPSATSSEGAPASSGTEEPAVESGTMETSEQTEGETSAVGPISKRKKARTTAGHGKKGKSALPSASPTDSPILLVSPREGDKPSGAVTERGSSLPKRGSDARRRAPPSTKRVLRKRKAKLW